MGQDVVCLIVDILPAVSTGLEDREIIQHGQASPKSGQAGRLQKQQVVLWEQKVLRGRGLIFSPTLDREGPFPTIGNTRANPKELLGKTKKEFKKT